MRRSLWLLSLGLLLAACGGSQPPPFQPVADVKQLMASVVDPAADVYWEAVGTVIDDKGVTEIAPATAEEWDQVRNAAYVFAEAGNLLMMSSRAKDGGEWMKEARALVDAGQKAVRAAESHDRNAVFNAGAEVYDVCTSCHVKYALDLQSQEAAKAGGGSPEPKKQP
jgi:hypothetical protein